MVAARKTFLLCPLSLIIAVTALSLVAVVAVPALVLPVQAAEVTRCSAPMPYYSFPVVAYGGGDYLIVWKDKRSPGIYGTRVSAGGTVLDPAGIPIGGPSDYLGSVAVAFDGTNYLVVWEQMLGSGSYAYCGRRVSTGGIVLDPDSIVISTPASYELGPGLSVAFDGVNYLVVWADRRNGTDLNVYGARMTKGGVVLDPGGIAISTALGSQYYPEVAFGGTNFFVVWFDYRGSSGDIYGARVTVGGVVLDAAGIGISTAVNDQVPWGIAFDGNNYLVVWQDNRNGPYNIYGARVSAGGAVLDLDGIAISTASGLDMPPRVAFDGTNYLAVWTDFRNSAQSAGDIYGARVSTGGVVLDLSGIVICDATGEQSGPDISFDGTNYLVVWDDQRNGESNSEIYAARVTKGGVVLDPNGFTDLLFASASVTTQGGYVTISWQMGIETSASSFLVQRSESQAGEFLSLDLVISQSSGSSFSCTDHSVLPGKTYWYKIVLAGVSGEESYGPIDVHVDAVPSVYAAYQSYPNPFNPLCTIRYDVPKASEVSLLVFDASGSLVRALVEGWHEPGVYRKVWDGRADDGTALASGVYFYSIKSGDFVATHKMVLLR